MNNRKIKIIIFTRKWLITDHFVLNGEKIEQGNEYKYFGALFSYTGIFYEAHIKLVQQANRAMLPLLK